MLRTAHHERALQVCDGDESMREVVMTTFTITSLKLSLDIRTMSKNHFNSLVLSTEYCEAVISAYK